MWMTVKDEEVQSREMFPIQLIHTLELQLMSFLFYNFNLIIFVGIMSDQQSLNMRQASVRFAPAPFTLQIHGRTSTPCLQRKT